jgi:hypothetical protein
MSRRKRQRISLEVLINQLPTPSFELDGIVYRFTPKTNKRR